MILLTQEGPVYMIRRNDIKDPEYFLFDRLVQPNIENVVLWTPVQFKAHEFYTEETVETFLFDFLRNRPCEIIRIK